MSSNRNHQEAHGLGQIEEQLADQARAAAAIQDKTQPTVKIGKRRSGIGRSWASFCK